MTNVGLPPMGDVSPATRAGSSRRRLVVGSGLVGAGVVAGAIVGGTLLSQAATPSASVPAQGASTAAGNCPDRGQWPNLTGVVTKVGTSTVDIKIGSASAKTYSVTSKSDIDKNGEAKLSSLKVGDKVRFSATAGDVIEVLHAGQEGLDGPHGWTRGGPRGWTHGGPHGSARGGWGLNLSGVVTQVGTKSVSIKSGTAAAKTYSVTSKSDIDKNGEAKLSALKVGDKVRFSATAGNVIEVLHAGKEASDHPRGGPRGGGPWSGPGARPAGTNGI